MIFWWEAGSEDKIRLTSLKITLIELNKFHLIQTLCKIYNKYNVNANTCVYISVSPGTWEW